MTDWLAISVVAVKGLAMLLLIGGGLYALTRGHRTFQDGASRGRGQLAFEGLGLKLSARSVGSIVMATAVLWAWAGVAVTPNLERSGDDIRIFSLKTAGAEVEAPEFATDWTTQELAAWNNEQFQTHLSALLMKDAWVRVNGVPGVLSNPAIDPASKEVTFQVGMPLFHVGPGGQAPPSTTITYSPTVEGMEVFLRPTVVRAAPR